MSKEEAIEKCARALVKSRGYREENWHGAPVKNHSQQ
jgi:hypothetical protein